MEFLSCGCRAINRSPAEGAELKKLIRAPETHGRQAARGRRILLEAARGKSKLVIADNPLMHSTTVSLWRVRLEREG